MVDFAKLLKRNQVPKETQTDLFAQKFTPNRARNFWSEPTGNGLWSLSTAPSRYPEDPRGQRFTKSIKEGTPNNYSVTLVPMKPSEITERDKEFWLTNDKSWAWHVYLCGCTIEHILEFVGGRDEEFKQWIADVCAGKERCIYSGSFSNWPWTQRKEKLLWRMYCKKLNFLTACRLLGFSQEQVKAKLIELRRQNEEQ